MLVLKRIFGGSPKITLQNGEITRKVKNNPKRFLGHPWTENYYILKVPEGHHPRGTTLVARAIRNAIRANRFARIIRN